jgi:hypothetical protein
MVLTRTPAAAAKETATMSSTTDATNPSSDPGAAYTQQRAHVQDLLRRLARALEDHLPRGEGARDIGPAGDLARCADELEFALRELTGGTC